MFVCTSADQDDGKDSEKTVRTKASKSASADIQPVTATGGEKAVKNSSVRSKRRVKEEGKKAHVMLSCLVIRYGVIG